VTLKTKFDPSFPITDKAGKPTQSFAQYVSKLDAFAVGNPALLPNAVNDAAAAAAGVGIGSLYRNGSQLMVRVA
jgi:hypothetical protein